jgi:hypothetical protein
MRGDDFTLVALHPFSLGKAILADIVAFAVGCPYAGKFGLLSHNVYRREVKNHHPDLIMVTGLSVGNCWAAASLNHIPKVITVHFLQGESSWSKLRWQGFYSLFSGIFDRITFNSDLLRKGALGIYS